ncbi:hypothetical protein HZA87_05175 [Candidatus Uhrbacteria bacterium]|nr:hypothetical protein [Candidatus Uhrbacteria bacterium]
MALFRSMATALTQRAFETTTEKALNAGLQAGDDDNALATRVLNSVAADDSELVKLARTIPGFQFAAYAVFAGVGEFLGDHAEKLWPGDNRPQVKALRRVLKHVGPALVGITNATADVIESKVNAVVSPSTMPASNRKATLDVVYFSDELPDRILIPARDADHNIRVGDDGYPIFNDREAIRSKNQWLKTHKATTRQEGSGKDRRQIPVPAEKWPLTSMTLVEAISSVGLESLKEGDVEAIKKLLTPSTGEQWTPETWAVFRAYNASCADFERDGTFTWLNHEEGEGLVQTFKKAKAKGEINAREVHELVGVAFRDRIGEDGAPAGKFSINAVLELEGQVFDKWLGGEQPAYTKVVRAIRSIRRSAENRGVVNWLGVGAMIVATSWLIWLPIFLSVILLVVALRWYLAGLTGSDGGIPLAKQDAIWLTIKSGVMVLTVTWAFPVFQTATGWIRSFLFPTVKDDWLVDMGRKIAAFGLVICTGVTTYAIMLNVPPFYRVAVPVSALLGVGVGIGLVAAGYRAQAEEIISASAKPTLIVFGVLPLALAFLWGSYVGNPVEGQAVVGGITGYVAGSKWLQIVLVLVAALLVSVALSWFKYRKVPDGTKAGLRIAGAGPLLVFIVVCAIAGIVCSGIPEMSFTPAPVTQAAEAATQATAPDPVEAPRSEDMCDDMEISPYQRQQLGCDN